MQRITDRAKAHQRRERFNRWVKRHIIAPDPRSVAEQMADENSKDRSPVWFALVVLTMLAVYAGAVLWMCL